MGKSLFRNLQTLLKNIRIKFLDMVAPLSSWIALAIYQDYWVTNLAHKIVIRWESTTRKKEKLQNRWYSIHQPENWLLAVAIAFVITILPQLLVTLWYISPFCIPNADYGWSRANTVSTLETTWQVTAGLIGITFVIVIFLVEYANRDTYERRAIPVFFAETWMLFIASFGILVILSTGITSYFLSNFEFRTDYLSFLYHWQWVLFFLNTVLILIIFVRTVSILPKSSFTKKLKEFNQRIAAEVVEKELIDRVALDTSDKALKAIGVEFPIFEPDLIPGKDIVPISNLPRSIQRVVDINLKLVEIAYKHAKQVHPIIKGSDLIFYAKLDHRISNEKPGIAQINPVINHACVISYLKRSIKIQSSGRSEKSRMVEELVLNRDMILRALHNQEEQTVEDLLNHYIDLIEAFLQATDSYGVHFSHESASKEMRLFSDWKLVSTIIDQYRSLIPSFLEINDHEILAHFLRFPIDLMGMAILYKDHLIYQQFASLYPLIYIRTRDLQNPKQRESIIDYFVHRLIDHRRFILAPRLSKNNLEPQKLLEYKNYFQDLLVSWNKLLKEALDQRSDKRFGEFTDEVRTLVHEFYPDLDDTDILLLELRLENIVDETLLNDLSKQIERKKTIIRYKLDLANFKQRIFLGLGGWITHLYENDQITQIDYLKIIPNVSNNFTEVEQIYQAYIDDHNEERDENLLNWISWEMSEWPSNYGGVKSGSLRYETWLEKYFLIRLVELIPFQSVKRPSITPTIRSKALFESIEKRSRELLSENRWTSVFQGTGIDHLEERVTAILEMLNEAKVEQQILEEIDIKEAPLEIDLVDSFKREVIESCNNSAVIRKLVNKFGRSLEIYDEEFRKKTPFFGNFELIPKESFIKQNRIAYFGLGESYGRGLAEFEDRFLGSQFCVGEPITITTETFEDEIFTQSNGMSELGLWPIIFLNGKEVSKRMRMSKCFTPAWKVQNNPLGDIEIWGLFDGRPIIFNNGISANTILLLDIKRFGVLSQYKDADDSADLISIKIDLLSQEDAEEIILKNPNWTIHSESGKVLEHEEAIRKVLQNVSLQISEYCRFEEIDPQTVKAFSYSIGTMGQSNQEEKEGEE